MSKKGTVIVIGAGLSGNVVKQCILKDFCLNYFIRTVTYLLNQQGSMWVFNFSRAASVHCEVVNAFKGIVNLLPLCHGQ